MREANQAFYKSGGFAEVKTMKDNMTSEETQKWERKCRETKGREIMKDNQITIFSHNNQEILLTQKPNNNDNDFNLCILI